MPTENQEALPVIGTPEAEQHNAEIKNKLAEQGMQTGTKPEELQATDSALDALAAAVTEKQQAAPAVVEPEPAAEPEPPAPDPAVVEATAKAEAEKAEVAKRADEIFKGTPSLPPGASPKSSEAFSAVKIKAAQEISARDRELEETRAKLTEAEAKLSQGLDPEVQRELEEHRAWRAKLDVEHDPKFKEFDKQVSSSQEFIYAQLRKSSAITADVIDQIKKHGGPENVNLEKIFASIKDPTMQRIVEAKVADIEMAKFNKEQAIRAAKENIGAYQEQQQKAYSENVGAHNKATQKVFSQYVSKFPWFSEKPVDSKADEPTRKAAEVHNTFLKETKGQLDAAMSDDTPEMRALLLAGMAKLLYVENLRAGEKTQLDKVTKELAEANAKIEKFTKASVSRLRETGAAPGGKVEKPKPVDFNVRAEDALDAIATQITAERARMAHA